jgi:oligopeptide/dipeptide ABC transporter ATP-binding protein
MDVQPEVLRIDGLGVAFSAPRGTVRAVRDVSMTLRPGETVAIVGESGCGKSVTSLSVMGLLPPDQSRIVAGTIRFRRRNGEWIDLVTLPRIELPAIRGNEIAMIFQEPMTCLNPLHRVGDQIAEALLLHRGMRRSEAITRAAELLERVGISDPLRRLDAYPHELSGGMCQRVMIAMALACDPVLLIADEPTTALDVTIQAQIIALFQSLQASSQMTILFITHDLGVVAEIANRVLVMYAGEIVEEGDVVSVLTQPLHPYTKGLISAVPRIDRPQHRAQAFFSIPGQVPPPGEAPQGCAFVPRCRHARHGLCDAPVMPMQNVTDGRAVRCIRWRDLMDDPHG